MMNVTPTGEPLEIHPCCNIKLIIDENLVKNVIKEASKTLSDICSRNIDFVLLIKDEGIELKMCKVLDKKTACLIPALIFAKGKYICPDINYYNEQIECLISASSKSCPFFSNHYILSSFIEYTIKKDINFEFRVEIIYEATNFKLTKVLPLPLCTSSLNYQMNYEDPDLKKFGYVYLNNLGRLTFLSDLGAKEREKFNISGIWVHNITCSHPYLYIVCLHYSKIIKNNESPFFVLIIEPKTLCVKFFIARKIKSNEKYGYMFGFIEHKCPKISSKIRPHQLTFLIKPINLCDQNSLKQISQYDVKTFQRIHNFMGVGGYQQNHNSLYADSSMSSQLDNYVLEKAEDIQLELNTPPYTPMSNGDKLWHKNYDLIQFSDSTNSNSFFTTDANKDSEQMHNTPKVGKTFDRSRLNDVKTISERLPDLEDKSVLHASRIDNLINQAKLMLASNKLTDDTNHDRENLNDNLDNILSKDSIKNVYEKNDTDINQNVNGQIALCYDKPNLQPINQLANKISMDSKNIDGNNPIYCNNNIISYNADVQSLVVTTLRYQQMEIERLRGEISTINLGLKNSPRDTFNFQPYNHTNINKIPTNPTRPQVFQNFSSVTTNAQYTNSQEHNEIGINTGFSLILNQQVLVGNTQPINSNTNYKRNNLENEKSVKHYNNPTSNPIASDEKHELTVPSTYCPNNNPEEVFKTHSQEFTNQKNCFVTDHGSNHASLDSFLAHESRFLAMSSQISTYEEPMSTEGSQKLHFENYNEINGKEPSETCKHCTTRQHQTNANPNRRVKFIESSNKHSDINPFAVPYLKKKLSNMDSQANGQNKVNKHDSQHCTTPKRSILRSRENYIEYKYQYREITSPKNQCLKCCCDGPLNEDPKLYFPTTNEKVIDSRGTSNKFHKAPGDLTLFGMTNLTLDTKMYMTKHGLVLNKNNKEIAKNMDDNKINNNNNDNYNNHNKNDIIGNIENHNTNKNFSNVLGNHEYDKTNDFNVKSEITQRYKSTRNDKFDNRNMKNTKLETSCILDLNKISQLPKLL